ncbi:DUF3175 domain-containing protein [Peristeroidobacter agariperforans]|uniref:DUF3175 domain-containing protein n=1 Tax=Peristeroidobacter agariperforans TaxID=268404 RepID=UPI00101D308D|nr:DUF3175 domain-containing protein [Peristeroidobacter agariperforans]
MATARRKRWSQRVTQTSDALTLEEGVFTRASSRGIALSLKRSADRSHKRKSSPYRSAMSMLTFYGNRAGKTLPAASKRKLEDAKEELRKLYGKTPENKAAKKKTAKKKVARKSPRKATRKSTKRRKARG